jgi:hypothetical protein
VDLEGGSDGLGDHIIQGHVAAGLHQLELADVELLLGVAVNHLNLGVEHDHAAVVIVTGPGTS